MTTEHKPTQQESLEYEERYQQAVAIEAKVARQVNGNSNVIWSPQEGSQHFVMKCSIFELLFHGTRGPGKTDTLLMCFAQHVGKGFGQAWRGIIFRETYPQLADVQAKSEKWFRQIFGDKAKFNKSKMMWEWDTGEVLMFRHMNSPSDYWNYHGHEYPFIGWEELTNWATDECYKSMISCCRSSTPGVPRMLRATTNPYGAGHTWVKERFRLGGRWWETIIVTDSRDIAGRLEPPRCAVHGHIDENKILLEADPNYVQNIIASASNPAMAAAWMDGSWDIVAGGMIGDIWDPQVHVLEPFNIPQSWRIDRSFDWGSSAPFSVGWWAESDGSDIQLANGQWMSTVRGDLFRINEWYGWTGKPNEGVRMLAVDIAKGIIQRQLNWKIHDRVKAGPADSAIYSAENGNCIGTDMEKKVKLDNGEVYKGVYWTRADKRAGSRKTGWEQIRKMLKNAKKPAIGPREHAGLFVFSNCTQFLRTMPVLPRCDKDPDEVHKDAEDHIADEVRYRIRSSNPLSRVGRTVGHH
jgi:hypothetical protein